MNDLFLSLLRVLVSLAIVILLILIILPYLLPFIQKFKWMRNGKDSHIKLKNVIPISKNMFLVELEIKEKLFVVAINERTIKVIYKDEVDNT